MLLVFGTARIIRVGTSYLYAQHEANELRQFVKMLLAKEEP